MKEDEVGAYVARMEGMRNAYKILVGKPEGKSPFWRPSRTRVDKFKMDLKETGWRIWTGTILYRIGINGALVNKKTNVWSRLKAGKFLTNLRTVSSPGSTSCDTM
jgi:hypothetical protein